MLRVKERKQGRIRTCESESSRGDWIDGDFVGATNIHGVQYRMPAACRCVDDRAIAVVDSAVLLTIAESGDKQNEQEFEVEHGLAFFLRRGWCHSLVNVKNANDMAEVNTIDVLRCLRGSRGDQ